MCKNPYRKSCSWRDSFEPRHEKAVFGVCDQVRLKPACLATETSQSFEISATASRGIILSQ